MPDTNNINWTVILNPYAGGGKGSRECHKIEKLLDAQGVDYELVISEYPKHSILLSKNAIMKGAKHIIVVGGDGTLNEVVNGVFQQKKYPPEEITLAMIPVGTGNDWIKTFGVPNNYSGAINKIREAKTILQDIGKITFLEDDKKQIRYFSNMAGFGFDALAAQKANHMKENGRSGLLVYLTSLLAAFVEYKTKKVNIVIDGKEIEDYVFTASIGIGKYNGGGMMQAPDALPDNGVFEVTYIKRIGIWGILTNLVALYNGSYTKDKRVVCNKAKEIGISAVDPIAGEVDGEWLGKGHYHVEIIPRKLRVIVGRM